MIATFQQGTGGYSGEVDTFLYAGSPDASQAAAATLIVDGPPPVADERQILLRFNALFQSEGGPIPNGSTINSATLRINVTNASANGAEFHRMLLGWADTDTWNILVNGVQRDGIESVATADVTSLYNGSVPALHSIDVTSSVAAWSAGAANRGWVLVTPGAGTDSWQFDSAEAATVASRPLAHHRLPAADPGLHQQLPVRRWPVLQRHRDLQPRHEHLPVRHRARLQRRPACTTDTCNETTNSCDHVPSNAACSDANVCTDDVCNPTLGCQYTNNSVSCSDSNACTTADTCSGGSCVGGPAPDCSDGVACTTDSCDTGLGCQHLPNCPVGQSCNLGTGLCDTSLAPPLPIVNGDSWRYAKGTATPPANWAASGFDDAGWLLGASAFGYGTDCQALRGTTLTDMSGAYVSLYMRRGFRVDNPATVSTLTLTVDYDDGFVAYLNGTEVARRNVAGTPPSNTQLATADHECSACGGTCNAAEAIDISAFRNLLVAGTNVLSIQAHNLTSTSTDFTMMAELSATESQCTGNPDCDDGLFCNGAETCVGSACQSGTPPNCDDGVACTTDSCNETTDACDHTSCPLIVNAEGSRYIAVTPPSGVTTVALRVSSAGLACLPRYVAADGTLGTTPVYRTPAEWGTVHLHAQPIAPSRLYTVEALRTGGVAIGSGSATTWAWGDANNANGVDMFDILCVLDGSQNKFVKCTLYATDLRGPIPNGVVDNDDIQAMLDAYESKPYPESDPCFGVTP